MIGCGPIPGFHCLLHLNKYLDTSGAPKIDLGVAARIRTIDILYSKLPVSLEEDEEFAYLQSKVSSSTEIENIQLHVAAEEELDRWEKMLEWIQKANDTIDTQMVQKPRKCFAEKMLLIQRLEEDTKTAGIRLDELGRELRVLYSQVHRGRDLFPQQDRDSMIFEDVLSHSLRYAYRDQDAARAAVRRQSQNDIAVHTPCRNQGYQDDAQRRISTDTTGFRFSPESDSEDGIAEDLECQHVMALERYCEEKIEVTCDWRQAWSLVQRSLFDRRVLLVGQNAPKVLEMVILWGRQIPGAEFLYCPTLESLTLRLKPHCIPTLAQVLKNHANMIHKLSIEYEWPILREETEWPILRPVLRRLTNLRHLSIIGAKNFDAEDIFRDLPHGLETIDLSSSRATRCWRYLTCCRTLKHLRMRRAGVDGADAADLAVWLPLFEGLENVDLAENNIDEEGAEKLVHVLQIVPTKLVINLSQNNIRRNGRLSEEWEGVKGALSRCRLGAIPTVLGL